MRRLVCLLLLGTCIGCGDKPPTPDPNVATQAVQTAENKLSPEETVRRFVSAYLNKRLGEYYDMVASFDKDAKSLEELQSDFAPGSSDLVTDYVFQYTIFRVDSSSVDGDSALVYGTSESPDLRAVVREARTVERSIGPGADLSTKMSLLNERLRAGGGGRVENPTVYFLVQEPRGWRVVMGWADEKAFKEQMRVDSAQAGGT